MGSYLWAIVVLIVAIVAVINREDRQTRHLLGQVTCPDGTILPEHALLRVSLVDVTDKSAIRVIANQTTNLKQGGFKFLFDVAVRPSLLVDSHVYAFWAEIVAADKVLLNSGFATPVDFAKTDAFVLHVVPARGPDIVPLPTVHNLLDADLADTHWVVEAISRQPAPADPGITLSVTAQGRIFGNTGGNDYVAEAQFIERDLKIVSATATRTIVAPMFQVQEAAFFVALQNVTRYHIRDSRLRLLGPSGEPLLELRPLHQKNAFDTVH